MGYYLSSREHILAELERIDLLIQARVWQAQQMQPTDQALPGLFISPQEIEALLAQPIGLPRWATEPPLLSLAQVRLPYEHLTTTVNQQKIESLNRNIPLRLEHLSQLCRLTSIEADILLIGLAPEIDLRYERFYAYLQDDINKKRPSVDLVLNLLSPSFEAKLAARQYFTPGAALLKNNLLYLGSDSAHSQLSWLGQSLKVDDRIVNYLLDFDELDARLLPLARIVTPQTQLENLLLPSDVKNRLIHLIQDKAGMPICYFQGGYGVGKQSTAEALCRELGLRLLVINTVRLLQTKNVSFETVVRLANREAHLQNAALYWQDFEALLTDERQVERDLFMQVLADWPGLTFLAGEASWQPARALPPQPFIRLEFSRPGYSERKQLWARSLNGSTGVDPATLANQFRFSGGQISDAAATAYHLARWRNPGNGLVTMADLYTACRLHSNPKLSTLAQKITPHYTWADIVLPIDRLEQLREICNAVKYRTQVYHEWGFERKLALGKGVNVLFAGPSGTGKTMSADIIAGELSLDLYKIDLSSVVSKYIGETEKNLARIFAEAESSNAILFFDEADALFGKRTEVRDSHDRYANIEISYLLQRMEEYEGMVILTTNLRKNMDDAFVRRVHFTIEFPLPDESHRRRIWEQIWPAEMPRSPDFDLDFMARSFEISGGNIRNIALTAAFLAADEQQMVGMSHLIRAIQREYQKMGKVVTGQEFGMYADQVRRKN